MVAVMAAALMASVPRWMAWLVAVVVAAMVAGPMVLVPRWMAWLVAVAAVAAMVVVLVAPISRWKVWLVVLTAFATAAVREVGWYRCCQMVVVLAWRLVLGQAWRVLRLALRRLRPPLARSRFQFAYSQNDCCPVVPRLCRKRSL